MQPTMRRYIDSSKATLLLLTCWITYCSAYIGRYSFSAVLAQIVADEGFAQSAMGLISTGFFVCYGAGQVLSGVLGDRLSPRLMAFGGIMGSAVCNLCMAFMNRPRLMLIIWCVNGLCQSMTWAPLIRVLSERLRPAPCRRACICMAYTQPAGLLLVYGATALLVQRFSWRGTFVFSFAVLASVAVFWFVSIGRLKRDFTDIQPAETVQSNGDLPAQRTGMKALLPLLILLSGTLIVQGALRDGVMTWVPTYLNHTFQTGVAISTFSTMALPVLNLGGVQAGNLMLRRFRCSEIQASLLLFLVSALSALLITLVPGVSMIWTVLCFAVITACMTGINMLLVSLVPTYFVRWNRVAFVSGLLNAMVYVGSSVATYGLGALADALGWNALFVLLCLLGLLGALILFAVLPLWKSFRGKVDA